MRSRLEARYAAAIGATGWQYEPRAYANQDGQYLPDFELVDLDGKTSFGHFVEVKPTRELALKAIGRARIIFSSLPDALIWITWPRSAFGKGKETMREDWDFIELDRHGWIDYSLDPPDGEYGCGCETCVEALRLAEEYA